MSGLLSDPMRLLAPPAARRSVVHPRESGTRMRLNVWGVLGICCIVIRCAVSDRLRRPRQALTYKRAHETATPVVLL